MNTPDPGLLPDLLRHRAFNTPDRLALIAGDHRLTFAELDARVDCAAMWLLDLGVSPDDHIALHLPNSLAFVELVHAISRIGAVLVPINLRLTADEISWQLRDVQASRLITTESSSELLDFLAQGLSNLPVSAINPHNTDYGVGPRGASRFREYHDPTDTHAIVYTSGTTGRPKGAMLTYGNHWWSAIGSGLNLGIHGDDRWLAVLPLFHVGGLSILMRSIIYGTTVVVHESFDPESVNQSILEDRVTIISVVSTMLRRMLEAQGSETYPVWLRCVLLGGGPAPRPLLEECASREVPVTQTYGLTESSSQIATLPPEDALPRLGSAGKPLFPNEISIENNDQTAAPGEPGEILVRGPVITPGYYGRPDDTSAVFRNTWFHTGDAGYLDADGYLYVLDRRDDLIVTGGENVYPAEVEAVLSGHPDVIEAGVIGIADPEWGQRVVAVVSVDEGISSDAMTFQSWCRSLLAGYKAPTEFRFVNHPLPRNAGGKLLRRELRATWN